jgi:hypothetical protein
MGPLPGPKAIQVIETSEDKKNEYKLMTYKEATALSHLGVCTVLIRET